MSDDPCTEKLLDLAYGELSGREARRVEAHVASCDACRAELERIRGTRALMSGLGHEEAPLGGERILLAAAREAARARSPRRRRSGWFLSFGVAAAALVAVGAVSYRILAMRPGPLEGPGEDALLGGPYAAEAPPPERQEALPPEARAPGEAAPSRVEAEAARPRAKAAPAEAERAPARRAERPDRGDPAARPPSREPAPLGAPRPAGADRHAAAPADARAAGAAADDGGAPTVGAAGPEAAPPAEPSPPARDPAARADRAAPAPPAPAAPAQAAQAAPRAPSRAPSKSAAPASPPASEAPEAGALRGEDDRPDEVTVEVRAFPGCEGEARRRVERDAQGRIVRYVREGTFAGRRLVVEHVYGEDGALARATVRDLDRPGAALDPVALGVVLVTRAADAHADAPPRCGR